MSEVWNTQCVYNSITIVRYAANEQQQQQQQKENKTKNDMISNRWTQKC